jgi:pimeloyl-ACP methyl ester carboxylesterase
MLRHDNQRSDPIGSPVMTPNPNRATATLVFVHGACFGPWIWAEHLMPHFEALGLRCFAPDLQEAWPQAQWSASIARFPLARYTDRLHGMLDQLSGPKILVGHAMGARIVEGLIERGAPLGIGTVHRFFARHGITRKKRPGTRKSKTVPTS